MTRGYDQKKAEYSQAGDIDTKLLQQVIPEYNQAIRNHMIQDCKAVVEDADKIGLKTQKSGRGVSARIVPLTIKGAHGEPSHYTIKFAAPVVQYIPPAFAPLHFWCKFTPESVVEYIPCYIMNLNRVALAKFYLKSDTTGYDRIGNGLFSRLDPGKGKRVTLSSTNILLPGSAEEHVQDFAQETIRKCFEQCWWHLPTPSGAEDTSCMHNLVYHSSTRIKGILQMRKTLLRIIKICKPDMRCIIPGGREIECVRANVTLLVDDGKRIFSERRVMFMAKNVSGSVKEGDIMNAIIATQNIKQPKVSMVVGHADPAITPGDKLPVMGLAIWDIVRHKEANSSLTLVEDIDEIVNRVSNILKDNSLESDVFYPDFAWRFIRSDAKKAVSDIFPLYVREGNLVYHLPPAIMSFLITTAPHMLVRVESVSAIARLFDLVSANTKEWRKNAQTALDAHEFRDMSSSSGLNRLLSHMPTVAVEVALSKIFSKHAGI